jgi:hypothetical protein
VSGAFRTQWAVHAVLKAAPGQALWTPSYGQFAKLMKQCGSTHDALDAVHHNGMMHYQFDAGSLAGSEGESLRGDGA